MSAYRRIPDLAQKGGEGRVMTQLRHSHAVARASEFDRRILDAVRRDAERVLMTPSRTRADL